MAGCCGGIAVAAEAGNEPSSAAGPPMSPSAPGVVAYVRTDGAGRSTLNLLVEGVHCGGCVSRIERGLAPLPDVEVARVNLSSKRLSLAWRGPAERGAELAAAVEDLGYRVVPFDPQRLKSGEAAAERDLLRAMAVAGFATGNIMLLSVSIWAGEVQGMGAATRELLHWFSALIALPTVLYAGRPFYRSALTALAARRTNMDVPISLAILLATGMSLHEIIRGGPHAYFESAVMLLFFLLVGRFLDRRARGRALSAVERLVTLSATAVTVLDDDGTANPLPPDLVQVGMTVLVPPGERVAVDGVVVDGRSTIDTSLVTGETVPAEVGAGDRVFAGTVNHGAALKVRVTAIGEDTLLGEIVRLMQFAEQRKARYVALADRVARLYAPVVHVLALVTFVGWVTVGGMAWQPALMIAVAVLIITCPCALGLVVPAVQVIASGRLMRAGTLLKSATALERLITVDTVVFDKTGTLTIGRPELVRDGRVDDETLRDAAAMAGASRHPLARAVTRAVPGVAVADGVEEVPGAGLRLRTACGREARLGSRAWCDVAEADEAVGPELWYAAPGKAPVRLTFRDPLRPDAAAVVGALRARGLAVELLSGDRAPTVRQAADALGIADWRAGCSPTDKCARLEELAGEGRQVLMVGDGLNDAPALAAATVSMSPSTAADVSQTAADAVFLGDRLGAVVEALEVAQQSHRVVRQNFVLAIGYNVIAIPVAMAGFVTPLIAAASMSASSIVVVLNALRLAGRRRAANGAVRSVPTAPAGGSAVAAT